MSKIHSIVTIVLLLSIIPALNFAKADPPDTDQPWEVLDQHSSTVFLDPGEIFSFNFDRYNHRIVMDQPGETLSMKALQAIEKVPQWTRTNLTRTFLEIENTKTSAYAQLILDCSDDRYLDELSFSISHTPPEVLEKSSVYPQVFMDNVETLYDNDLSIDYAEILDFTDHSTIRYWVNESGVRTSFDLPTDIYYWYVVHPKLTDEDPTFIDPVTGRPSSNGKFWRDWLYNHADGSYPLDTQTSTVLYPKNVTPPQLKQVLSGVDRVWNGESYRAPAGYLNNGTGNRRPWDLRDHAIEKISNWVGKTLPLNVREEGNRIGNNPERSVQPVRIYSNHYGNCGELQDLTVAAARSALIPARGVMNTGEDHVWSEFWERGWHQWDNYWSDGGSGIDNFGNYDADFTGSWGKELSAVYSWRGDDYVEMVTGNYSDTADFKATVVDGNGRPVDGARILLATENYYDPDYLTISTWGHTDINGEMNFEIGDSRNFWSQCSSPLGNDPPDSGGNIQVTQVIQNSQVGNTYTHRFETPNDISRPKASRITEGVEEGEFLIRLDYEVERSYLHGNSMFTENTFSLLSNKQGELDLYLTDEDNYQKCRSVSDFLTYEMNESASGGSVISLLEGGEHVIFSNMGCVNTEKLISYNVTIYSLPSVVISSPEDGMRITHTTIMEFSGSAHSNFGIAYVDWRIDEGGWRRASYESGSWSNYNFELDTNPLGVGEHRIEVRAITNENKEVFDEITILIRDDIIPELSISSPVEEDMVVQGKPLEISGTCNDDYRIEKLTLNLDDGTEVDIASSIEEENWTWSIDTSDLAVGDHDIKVAAEDPSGHRKEESVSFYLTEVRSPVLSISNPENGTVYKFGDRVIMEGEASDNVKLYSMVLYADDMKMKTIPIPDRDGYWSSEFNIATMGEGEHVLEVVAEDTEGNVNSSEVTIMVDATQPTLEILSPGEEELFAPEGMILIKARVEDEYGLEQVRLFFENRLEGEMILNGDWERELDISSLGSGTYEYHVDATDVAGWNTRIEGSFVIDGDEPSIYTYINDMEEYFVGDTVYLNGSVTEKWGISLFTVSTGDDVWNLTEMMSDGSYSFSWDTSGLSPGNYTFEIRAVDLVGNEEVRTITVSVIENAPEENQEEQEPPDDVDDNGMDPILLILIIFVVLLFVIIIAVMVILLIRKNQDPSGLPTQGIPTGQKLPTKRNPSQEQRTQNIKNP